MILKKEIIIPLLAILVLSAGTVSSIYIYSNQLNSDIDDKIIIISNEEISIDWIFSNVEIKNFKDLNSSGIALDKLIMLIGIICPSCYNYRFIGNDGYTKTVTWENMKNGLLNDKKTVIFSDLPKAFHVNNIKEIELIKNG
jgi:hypothetical protein